MITAGVAPILTGSKSASPLTASGDAPTGQAETLDQLYRQHWSELVGYVRRTFGDSQPDPEDAAQHAFTQFAALKEPELVLAPRAFLFRCSINFVVGHKRRNQTRTKFATSPEATFLFGEADEISGERVDPPPLKWSALM